MNSTDEKSLRESIRKSLKRSLLHKQQKAHLQEQKVRSWARVLIKEVISDKKSSLLKESKDVSNPHPNTGINKLRDAIRKAKPSIKSKFQQLTSSLEQRESFTNHLLSAFVSLFDQLDALSASEEIDVADQEIVPDAGATETDVLQNPDAAGALEDDSPLEDLLEGLLSEIDIEVDDDNENDVVSADINKEKETNTNKDMSQVEKDIQKKQAQQKERESFGSGQEGDATGRNQAYDTFNLVQSYFSDSYLDLDAKDDREMFKKWMLYNLKLLLDSYEEELNTGLDAPQIDNPQ
tara:strand:+ start:4031 stop:4909 length:879 start_codon:yes stop_codon:yes gene_type:complete